MILGRPTNQWVGLVTAGLSLAQVLIFAIAKPVGDDALQIPIVLGSISTFLGVLIAFLAGQPPTLAPGDKYVVQTPAGEDNVEKIANTNVTPIPPNASTEPVVNR